MQILFKDEIKTSVIETNMSSIFSEDDVLVKINVAGICRTDIYVYSNKIASSKIVLGHECAGIVVEKGKNVCSVSVGDIVSINPFIGCGICEHCGSNNFQLCESNKMLGRDTNGIFSEYICINQKNIINFNRIPSLNAMFFEPVLASSAVLNTSLKRDSDILIFGENRIAELTKRILVINGFKNVDCFMPRNIGKSYDFIIETVTDINELIKSFKFLKENGTYIIKSRHLQGPIKKLKNILNAKNIRFETAYYYNDIEHVKEMLKKQLHIGDLIGNGYFLTEFKKVFDNSTMGEYKKNYFNIG